MLLKLAVKFLQNYSVGVDKKCSILLKKGVDYTIIINYECMLENVHIL